MLAWNNQRITINNRFCHTHTQSVESWSWASTGTFYCTLGVGWEKWHLNCYLNAEPGISGSGTGVEESPKESAQDKQPEL